VTIVREPIVLEFTQPVPPISINALKGRHWTATRAALEPWKTSTWANLRNHLIRTGAPRGGPVEVQVELRFRSATRRDPHNYTSTVVKAIVDGIVQAGFVPDDTAEYVTVLDPILSVHPRAGHRPEPLRATITIRPRPEENHG
jgi:hypothetical protein